MIKDIEIKQDLMKVRLKDERVLYFPASKYAAFRQALKADQFVEIEGILINRNLINSVEPERVKEDVTANLSPDIRQAALARFTQFKSNIGRFPNKEEKLKIITKIQQGI